jgi:hypothetical protein
LSIASPSPATCLRVKTISSTGALYIPFLLRTDEFDAEAFHAQPERPWCHFHGLIDFYVNVNLKMGGGGVGRVIGHIGGETPHTGRIAQVKASSRLQVESISLLPTRST